MLRNFIGVCIIILFIVAAFWAGNYTHDYVSEYINLGTMPTAAGNNNLVPSTAAPAQTAPTAVTLSSTGSVKVLAVTPTSVTVQASYNQTKIFNYSSDTPVYSIVKEGQVGKGLGNITVGGNILVYWNKADPTKATSLAFPRDPSLAVTPDESVNFVSGIITTLTPTEVTITPSNGSAPVVITLTSLTAIGTAVAAGESGRGLTVGSAVTASGLASSGGKVTAKLILLSSLKPISF